MNVEQLERMLLRHHEVVY
jgi:hypothetical protein